MLFPTLRPSSLPVVVAQTDERHADRKTSVLEWYDRHRAYRTTSGSNEVVVTLHELTYVVIWKNATYYKVQY